MRPLIGFWKNGEQQVPPDFISCGAQNWDLSQANFPYSNSGNNVSGWVNRYGSPSWQTTGSIIRTNAEGWASIGVTAPAQFNATLDYQYQTVYEDIYLLFLDADLKRGYLFQIIPHVLDTDVTVRIAKVCDAESDPGSNSIITEITNVPGAIGTWHSLSLSFNPSTTTWTWSMNGHTVTHVSDAATKGQIGFGTFNTPSGYVQLRNIVFN